MSDAISHDIKYVLGLDGGGTKTIARLIRLDNCQQWDAKCGATSLSNDFRVALENITDVCQGLMINAGCLPQQVSAVFGLAGASDQSLANKLRQKLDLPFANIEIISDAKTSLLGANGGKPVAVVALGTGSVGMRLLESGKETLVGGWGFIPGDEGGGAKLGLMAVQYLLWELDSTGAIHSQLSQSIASEVGADRQAILQWLALSKPSNFAVFSRSVFAFSSKCEAAASLLKQHVVDVEELISMTVANTDLPLVLMGGLAEVTKKLLSEDIIIRIVDAKGDSLDGACLLAKQNYQRLLALD